MKWEYRVEGCGVDMFWDALLELHLKELGEQGWEVFHVTERKSDSGHPNEVHLKAYLKRQAPVLSQHPEDDQAEEAHEEQRADEFRSTIWVHDCDACVYLGPFSADGVKYDLYWCKGGRTGSTVIGRYGNDGPQYCSGLVLAQRAGIPYLDEALKRARLLGLEKGESHR
jgi:hypothetical protein